MNVLVICEFSGVVRDAFAALGHSAASCDFLPTEHPGEHFECDCRLLDYSHTDLLIAHPPCTYLAASGARWWAGRRFGQSAALEFVRWILDLPVPRICLENPVGRISTRIRPPDQTIQPWQFGHPETKATCLWLKGLPALVPTNVVSGRHARVHRVSPSIDRWKIRSRTLSGIAAAMASQWGAV